MQVSVVECLNCGQRRKNSDGECPRCSYLGWAFVHDLNETLRRRLRDRPPADRRLRTAS
jgi:hypothetical protein